MFNSSHLRRLSTFSTWPLNAVMSAVLLAAAGFDYTRQDQTVHCPDCGLTVDRWNIGDDPAAIHRQTSPMCVALARLDDTNSLPAMTASSLGSTGTASTFSDTSSMTSAAVGQNLSSSGIHTLYEHVLARASRSGAIVGSGNTAAATVALPHIDRTNPDFDELRREAVRRSTYSDWPPRAHAVPDDLARAGFFYTGRDDLVCCAFCRGYLRGWVPGDVPDGEHRKHFSDCPFVRGVDVKNVKIENEANSVSFITPAISSAASTSTQQRAICQVKNNTGVIASAFATICISSRECGRKNIIWNWLESR